MAVAEDAATVLEQFTHDVANLPAEIAHLLEEIAAKDKIIQECRSAISSRDNSLQKFIKVNGSLQSNPKEDAYCKTILSNFDKAQALQEEKVMLSDKAGILLERHLKRLDAKIRDLISEGTITNDPPLPSVLHSNSANRGSIATTPVTGTSTPLHPLSVNALPSVTIANSSIARLAHPGAIITARAGVSAATPQSQHSHLKAATHPNSAPNTPAATILLQRHRESSVGATDQKRRRLNASLNNIPATSSGLARQSSLGPIGTPKTGTPTGTRAGSAGPRSKIVKPATSKKVLPASAVRKILAQKSLQKKASKRAHGGVKAGSDDEDDSALSEVASEADSPAAEPEDEEVRGTATGGAGEEEDDAGDDNVYCFCQKVSHGDMVACDNEKCPYEWFHWDCVGLTEEPKGKWYCDVCKKTLGMTE